MNGSRVNGSRVVVGLLAAALTVAVACAPSAREPGDRAPDPVLRRGFVDDPDASAPLPGAAKPSTYVADGERASLAGCALYPRNNVFHADITSLPVTADSARTIAAAGAGLSLRGPSSLIWQGSRGGIPINVVDSREVPPVDVLPGTYHYLSDLAGHPIPADPRIEGYPGIAWDRHMLLLDTATCTTSEFFWVSPPNPFIDSWRAATAVKMDLGSNTIRDRGSAKASGLSMLAGMIRHEELAAGRIDHMLEASFPVISNRPPLWPASRTDGRSDDPASPPMGTVFRLRPDVDLGAMGPHALVIARALQRHGLIVSDTGPDVIGLASESHPDWDATALAGLSELTLSDFEVVDMSRLMVSEDSYEIR